MPGQLPVYGLCMGELKDYRPFLFTVYRQNIYRKQKYYQVPFTARDAPSAPFHTVCRQQTILPFTTGYLPPEFGNIVTEEILTARVPIPFPLRKENCRRTPVPSRFITEYR